MNSKTLNLNESLYQYLLSVSLREPEILQQLRQETANHPGAIMQISPDQGQFLALLVQLTGVKKALEIGVFTGYSALCVALALPPQGTLIACDVSEEYTKIARRYWHKANVENKIDLRLAPAVDTLNQLLESNQEETFDFVFIDADKINYLNYYEKSLQLLRTGGLMVIDNVLWSGRVADLNVTDQSTQALREFNQTLHQDDRITLSLIPVADGLTLALKR